MSQSKTKKAAKHRNGIKKGTNCLALPVKWRRFFFLPQHEVKLAMDWLRFVLPSSPSRDHTMRNTYFTHTHTQRRKVVHTHIISN